jgi:hypothetical protein
MVSSMGGAAQMMAMLPGMAGAGIDKSMIAQVVSDAILVVGCTTRPL